MPVIQVAAVERNLTPTVTGVAFVVDDCGVSDAGKMFAAAIVVNEELNGVDANPSVSAALTATR
jgi:hypothetical protein